MKVQANYGRIMSHTFATFGYGHFERAGAATSSSFVKKSVAACRHIDRAPFIIQLLLCLLNIEAFDGTQNFKYAVFISV